MNQSAGTGNSGDGSRPITDGGVDNIGAGEKWGGRPTATGELAHGPAPHERMGKKRSDKQSMRDDDSAPFGLKQNAESEPDTEPLPAVEDYSINHP